MTALDDPNEDSLNDNDPADDEFANRLAEMDEYLTSGNTARMRDTDDDPVLENRLREARACLDLLNSAWSSQRGNREQDAAEHTVVRVHPQRIGRFQVEKELGCGGHGVVFLAHDPRLKRQVAIKVPRPENLVSSSMRARFQQEAATAANLNHPNLVAIHEFDSNGPITYLVMDYCPGVSLATWLKQLSDLPDPRLAVHLLLPLVNAVAYMHAHGVLHRDIKPANILLDRTDSHEGDPLPGVPKLTDFGLAILAEANTRHSLSGATVGTLAYMPPEQVNMKGSSIGPRLDIFSLGAVLYECLTGKSPFQGATEADTIRQLLTNDPVPPRQLRHLIPRDLDVICLKCLEKDPEHRYPSASALADDLNRLLNGEPIHARPASRVEVVLKMARRYPSVAAMSAITTLALLCLLGLGIWHTVSLSEHSRSLAKYSRSLEEHSLSLEERGKELQSALTLVESSERQLTLENYAVQIRFAESMQEKDGLGGLSEFLDKMGPKSAQADHRGFEWYYLKNLGNPLRVLRGHRASVNDVAISPDGTQIVSCSFDNMVHFWDAATGINLGTLQAVEPNSVSLGIGSLAYCRDGTHIVSLATNAEGRSEVTIWDVASKDKFAQITDARFKLILDVVASPTDDLVGFSGLDPHDNSFIATWNWKDSKLSYLEPLPNLPEEAAWHAKFSPDGRKLVAHGATSLEILSWDMPSGKPGRSVFEDRLTILCVDVSPDSNLLAVSTSAERIEIWDFITGKRLRMGNALAIPPANLAFHPSGLSIAMIPHSFYKNSPGWGIVRLFSTSTAEPISKELSVGVSIGDIAWTPDGKTLAVACGDHHLRLWQPFAPPSTSTLSVKGRKEVWALAFSPDSKTLAVGYDDEQGGDRETLKLWDIESEKEIHRFSGHKAMVTGVAFSPEGDKLYSASYDKTIDIWDVNARRFIQLLGVHGEVIRSMVISSDGKKIASCSKDGVFKIYSTETGRTLFYLATSNGVLHTMAFDPAGDRVAVADNESNVSIWNVRTNEQINLGTKKPVSEFAAPSLAAPPGQRLMQLTDVVPVPSLAFSPDGNQLATANQDGIVTIYDLTSQSEPMRLTAHKNGVNIAVAFAPDGRTLATGGSDNAVRLWHVATGRELLTFSNLSASVNRLAFSPDGRHLAAGLFDGNVRLWHAAAPD